MEVLHIPDIGVRIVKLIGVALVASKYQIWALHHLPSGNSVI